MAEGRVERIAVQKNEAGTSAKSSQRQHQTGLAGFAFSAAWRLTSNTLATLSVAALSGRFSTSVVQAFHAETLNFAPPLARAEWPLSVEQEGN
jgi:hypothetical protein